MEGVDDVLEAKPHGRVAQLVRIDLAAVEGAARIQESAALKRSLAVGVPQVLSEVPRERFGEILERDLLALLHAELEQRLR